MDYGDDCSGSAGDAMKSMNKSDPELTQKNFSIINYCSINWNDLKVQIHLLRIHVQVSRSIVSIEMRRIFSSSCRMNVFIGFLLSNSYLLFDRSANINIKKVNVCPCTRFPKVMNQKPSYHDVAIHSLI